MPIISAGVPVAANAAAIRAASAPARLRQHLEARGQPRARLAVEHDHAPVGGAGRGGGERVLERRERERGRLLGRQRRAQARLDPPRAPAP